MPSDADRFGVIETIIEDFKERLEIDQTVEIVFAPDEERLVSVRRAVGSAFVMSFHPGFLATLNRRELEAAIAHELGHVWIFTHHPYLHTEALANQKAMLLVSRDSLQRMYGKVREFGGAPQELPAGQHATGEETARR